MVLSGRALLLPWRKQAFYFIARTCGSLGWLPRATLNLSHKRIIFLLGSLIINFYQSLCFTSLLKVFELFF